MAQGDAESELDFWEKAKEQHGHQNFALGSNWSLSFQSDPKELVFALSRYKFAAKMLGRNSNILELGCGEGVGTPILSEFASSYTGVDPDNYAISSATQNWGSETCSFIKGDLLNSKFGQFDSIISIGIFDHIDPEIIDSFFDTIYQNLSNNGIGIVETLNQPTYNSTNVLHYPNQQKETNEDRLREYMGRIFNNVFIFAMNDEVMHTGSSAMAQHLFALGCYKK